MGNEIFKAILDEKIQSFVENYTINSKNIFVNEEGNLIHPRRIWKI